MTRKDLTEIVFILDRSGSMAGLESDTIGGFNAFVENQKQEPGEARLTTVLFDNEYELLHNGVDIKNVSPIGLNEYYVRGTTALLDAVGKTINKVGSRLSATHEDDRPGHVVFVITTDGLENASREFTVDKIKEMIEHQTNKYNWKFIFLGANIDAIGVAESYGIASAANYSASAAGTQSVYKVTHDTVRSIRKGDDIDENWSKDIE